MTREAFTIAAIAFVCGTAAAAPLVTYESPCECRDYHGKGRLTEKNDAALPPTDPNAIQAVQTRIGPKSYGRPIERSHR